MFRPLFLGALLAFACLPACKSEGGGSTAARPPAPAGVQRGLLIARAGGSIDGVDHSNSLEALRCNHARGFRWFEIDLEVTADNELVCFHEGDEKAAGLKQEVTYLPVAQVESQKFADRFAIPRFSALLAEADRLGDVVLVLDTGGSQEVEQALSRLLGSNSARKSRIVLQARGLEELAGVAELSKSLGTDMILNVSQSDVDDAKIEEAVKQQRLLAVAINSKRFTPWLAERMRAAGTPVLVHTVNDHKDIVSLSRAGADGFYTDRYVPFERISADAKVLMECGKERPSEAQLRAWTDRDLAQRRDFKLPKCAKRTGSVVQLTGCDEGATVQSNALPVPGGRPLRVDVEVEAGETGGSFWLELVQKGRGVLKQRESITLAPKERRAVHHDVDLPKGSQGVEARLGVSSPKDRLTLHRFRVSHGESLPAGAEEPAEDTEE